MRRARTAVWKEFGLTHVFAFAANYLEVADIVTATSPNTTAGPGAMDGMTVDGTFIPLNQ